MSGKIHTYDVAVEWTGNKGDGTSSYRGYDRSYDVRADGKPTLQGSSDPAFRGDASCWNPEDLLVASASACHKLTYLHLCSVNKVIVTAYVDQAHGVMEEGKMGGKFVKIILRPTVTITADSDADVAKKLHHDANSFCFIANSVSFPIEHEPTIVKA